MSKKSPTLPYAIAFKTGLRKPCRSGRPAGLRDSDGSGHGDLHPVTERGEDADQKIRRYVFNVIVQDGCYPCSRGPERLAISACVSLGCMDKPSGRE